MRVACLSLALCLAAASTALAQDYDVDVSPDGMTIDNPAAPAKHRRGRRLVSGEATLAQPIVDSGRVISRVRVMQEWDCAAVRYRTVRKTFRDDDGHYVHSDPRDAPWTEVASGTPAWDAMKRVCPDPSSTAPEPAAPSRAGPQVVTMPRD